MEISQNQAYMYGQKFKIFTQNVQIAAGIGPNCQFLLGLPIWPQKTPNFPDWPQKWLILRLGVPIRQPPICT